LNILLSVAPLPDPVELLCLEVGLAILGRPRPSKDARPYPMQASGFFHAALNAALNSVLRFSIDSVLDSVLNAVIDSVIYYYIPLSTQ
jgi:hypothetical protein